MPERPNFNAMARSTTGFIRDRDPERLKALELNIIEQLRQVWNARGAADLETMGPIIAKLSDTMDPDHAREFVVDALRSLDR